jgi:hypothetical protein
VDRLHRLVTLLGLRSAWGAVFRPPIITHHRARSMSFHPEGGGPGGRHRLQDAPEPGRSVIDRVCAALRFRTPPAGRSDGPPRPRPIVQSIESPRAMPEMVRPSHARRRPWRAGSPPAAGRRFGRKLPSPFSRAEISLHLRHEITAEWLQILIGRPVLGREDDAKLVAVIDAAGPDLGIVVTRHRRSRQCAKSKGSAMTCYRDAP